MITVRGSKAIMIFGVAVMLLITSCSHKQKFDRKFWKDGNGIDFPFRNNMIDDLLANHKLKGLKLKQVTDTLGWPQGKKKDYIYYDINIKYDGLPPSYVKRLFVDFNADSIVTNLRIYEHQEPIKKK